jgi:hypothetical protein
LERDIRNLPAGGVGRNADLYVWARVHRIWRTHDGLSVHPSTERDLQLDLDDRRIRSRTSILGSFACAGTQPSCPKTWASSRYRRCHLHFQTRCQGRSKTRPVAPVEYWANANNPGRSGPRRGPVSKGIRFRGVWALKRAVHRRRRASQSPATTEHRKRCGVLTVHPRSACASDRGHVLRSTRACRPFRH